MLLELEQLQHTSSWFVPAASAASRLYAGVFSMAAAGCVQGCPVFGCMAAQG